VHVGVAKSPADRNLSEPLLPSAPRPTWRRYQPCEMSTKSSQLHALGYRLAAAILNDAGQAEDGNVPRRPQPERVQGSIPCASTKMRRSLPISAHSLLESSL
jgi:hypothetical protein